MPDAFDTCFAFNVLHPIHLKLRRGLKKLEKNFTSEKFNSLK